MRYRTNVCDDCMQGICRIVTGGYVSADVPCGVRNRNAKERYLEILSFQHFAKFTTFTTDGDDFRNKVLKDKIEVSVVLDLECVDMFTQWIE